MKIPQRQIIRFVKAVETTRGFVPNPDFVFRHLVSELGELDARMFARENLVSENLRLKNAENIGAECLDLIFLACYMADIYGVNLNKILPKRIQQIKKQYGVRI